MENNEPINPVENQSEIPMESGNTPENNGNDSLENKPEEHSIDSTQKPPIFEENINKAPENKETPSSDTPKNDNQPVNNEPSTTNTESTSSATPENANAPAKTPELVTRKSSRNLSKEERLKRQRELRKKRILESSHERLSRITKTYSQGSSYHDSDRDDSSLSRKSSSRSIHQHNLERTSSRNSINTNPPVQEADESQITKEPEHIHNHDLSRNSSINSINSLNKNDETINKGSEDTTHNTVNDHVEVNANREAEPNDNSSVNTSTEFNDNAQQQNDFVRLLFREMLKEEYNKSNNGGLGAAAANPAFTNINNVNDIKHNMDSLLTADKPFEALGKMFDMLGGDEKTTEEQKIAKEKYDQYCKLSKMIHTIVIFLYSLLVVHISLRAVDMGNDIEMTESKSGLSFVGNFFYRLANMDTLSHGKSIFGMTPWTFLVLLEVTLLAGQIGYQYVFNIKKDTLKELDLIPVPIINKAINLFNQYKLYIEVLVNDLFLYLFIIGFSASIGKIFY